MMNNLSIKKKLLIYNILIQIIILGVFSFSLYKTLEISSLDKIKSTLKIVLLDVVDDIIDHKDDLTKDIFHEEIEYKFKPLFIRLLQVDEKVTKINGTKFPDIFKYDINKLHSLKKDIIYFERNDTYVLSKMKITLDEKTYVVEVATDYRVLNSTFENLFYILIFIVPIILIFSIIGGYFLIHKSFLPIENILVSLKDISAKDLSKRLEINNNKKDEIDLLRQEINNLLSRLDNSFEKISQFSSDASHELKTPLTIIRGEIEIALRKDRDKDDYKKTLSTCLDEILSIQETVNDLLFLAKNEFSTENIDTVIYLDEIAIDSKKELENFAKTKDIQLILEINEPHEIKGEAKLLKIALKNIIKNAIIFSHDKSKVLIKNYILNDKIIIEVEDFGIGIDKNNLKMIFEKFYRVDKSRNKHSGGTGLGLSISEKIISLHNGKIEVESTENKGTKFKLLFHR
ncbi:HAMP domain-containing histidine kinase [Arcobacter arenosus]|uniref:histidine kinase n=2 Tax=Arcobacter arenosus TaxID=2576037 RepID=A0A5R8Y1Y8_9BACT|nr:HAMP domain-containing histidine kinase [Arcobacter arenosus]